VFAARAPLGDLAGKLTYNSHSDHVAGWGDDTPFPFLPFVSFSVHLAPSLQEGHPACKKLGVGIWKMVVKTDRKRASSAASGDLSDLLKLLVLHVAVAVQIKHFERYLKHPRRSCNKTNTQTMKKRDANTARSL